MFIFFYFFFSSPSITWQYLVALLFSGFYDVIELPLFNLKEFLNDNSELIPYLGKKQRLYFFSISHTLYHYAFLVFFQIFT